MTAAVYRDRVQETTTVTGTGTVTLGGAVGGYRTFATAWGADQIGVPYTIVDPTTGAWETGFGMFTLSGTTLSRSVRASSNSNALVSFAAGTKFVFASLIAAQQVGLGVLNLFTAAQVGVPVTLVQAAPGIDTDASLGNNFECVLTEDATLNAPSNLTVGQIVNHALQQPAAGGPYTITFDAIWDFGGAGAPAGSTGANIVDFVSGYYCGLTSKIIASYRKGS